jgi:hypothetical protein
MLLASIATLLANMWRGEDDEPVQPREFMPWLPEEVEDESEPADMSAMVEMLKTVFGAREVTDDGPQYLSEDDENWEP